MPTANVLGCSLDSVETISRNLRESYGARSGQLSRQDARLTGRGCTAWILSTEAAFLQAVRWKPSVERNPVTGEREDAKNDEV